MVLCGGDGDGLGRSESEDDEEFDYNSEFAHASVDRSPPMQIHDWSCKGKRKMVVKSEVPVKKPCPTNKNVLSYRVPQKYDKLENSSSILTKHEVTRLFVTANIPSTGYEFLIPSEYQRGNDPPGGYITVYKKQIESGLRFPMHGLVIEVCNAMNVSPSQLTPNAHGTIVGFILCAKLYKIPATADCFFSMYKIFMARTGIVHFRPRRGFDFLKELPKRVDWKTDFFFMQPTRNPWSCLTKWSGTFSKPTRNASLAQSAVNLGLMKHHFQFKMLLQKNILVHGGIEHGVPSPEPTFWTLMNSAAVTKFELLPNDRSPTGLTSQVPNPSYILDTTRCRSNMARSICTASLVQLKATQPANNQQSLPCPSPSDSIHLHKEFVGRNENLTEISSEPNAVKNSSVPRADDHTQQTLPPPLFAMSQILESMYVQKECYQKLQMEMQENTSELTLTKSRVEELEQELKLSEAKRVLLENRTSWAMEDVKILEKTVKDLMLDSTRYHDKTVKDALISPQEFLGNLDEIRRDAIENFKLSHEFLEGCERIRKDAIEGFKSSDEFLVFRDEIRKEAIELFRCSEEFYVAVWEEAVRFYGNDPWCGSAGQVHYDTKTSLYMESIKPER